MSAKETVRDLCDPAYTPRSYRCEWREEMQVDDVAWQTTCDNLFQFTTDGPTENSFKFCPYCGKRISVVFSSGERSNG